MRGLTAQLTDQIQIRLGGIHAPFAGDLGDRHALVVGLLGIGNPQDLRVFPAHAEKGKHPVQRRGNALALLGIGHGSLEIGE